MIVTKHFNKLVNVHIISFRTSKLTLICDQSGSPDNPTFVVRGEDLTTERQYVSILGKTVIIIFDKVMLSVSLTYLTFLPGGGGVVELFFDGVCGPRSETPTHI